MNTIVQQEISGCGFACVAMLADTSYLEVKKKANSLGIFSEDEKLWSETGYVRRLLTEYHIKASTTEVPFSTWEDLPNLALLAIKFRYEKGRPFWHWTVFRRNASEVIVHDPAAYLAENKRTDFENIAPEWSIEICQ
ncbi:MAG TPA: cysteine peptidase family C39 domain-containing protein [Geopsychrobacteraceae bacterium]|nr:cysteine peptidase family C39 domain-containing protein [Geopsychrobacteraceae bacterium]